MDAFDPHQKRAYTLDEIAALRKVVQTKYLHGTYTQPPGISMSRGYREHELEQYVNEQTRFWMLTGVTAADLLQHEPTTTRRWTSQETSPAISLRDALKPFAEFAQATGLDKLPDDLPMTNGSAIARRQVTALDFKRALKAFNQTPLRRPIGDS